MAILDTHDTIAAIASAPGPGLRGIVRLSGPESLRIACSGYLVAAEVDRQRPSRIEGAYRLEGLHATLPAALQLWPGPRSYTGQPMAEAHLIGSPPLVERLLTHFLEGGARLAEPGEFTLRSFLSGRLDLTRAEAVLGVIDARNPGQLDAALKQLAGGLFAPIAALRDRLLDVLAHVEANLDFVDEADVSEIGRAALAEALARGSTELAELAARLSSRERPEGHPRVVLVGAPNAGKSRLFNALIGRDRAIVSPLAGTTRDYLSALCDCDGLTVELIDTAGAEAPRDEIEARAQALRDAQAAQADLILDCVPATEPARSTDPLLPDRPRLLVRTKTDLGPTADRLESIPTSAATGEGLAALRRAIAVALQAGPEAEDLPTTTGARCRDSLHRASQSLAEAAQTLVLGLGDELVAVDLRQALDDLGRVVGETVTDDILDRIFQRFCIGK